MHEEEYQKRVLARASHRWHDNLLDFNDLLDVLNEFIVLGNRLDRVKKTLMYGRPFSWEEGSPQLPVEDALPPVPEHDQRLIHAMLGVATEGVEMMEAVLKYFQDNGQAEYVPFDRVNITEEFGDTAWYYYFGLATLAQAAAANRAQNDAKLEKRYGGTTFTEDAANTRDLEGERSVLGG